MSTYAIDSQRQEMTATGISSPVMEWIETPEGKRRPGDVQARDENTGMPLWAVEVTYRASSFGREYTATALVTIAVLERPEPASHSRITFDSLRVDVHVNKAGGYTERWSAEGVKQMTPENSRPKAVDPKSGDPKAVA